MMAYSASRSDDTSDPQAHRLRVARIGKPHGIRGEVTVQLFTDDPAARLGPGALLHVGPDTTDASEAAAVHSWRPGEPIRAGAVLRVQSQRWNKAICLLRFEEATDRNAAEELRNHMLFVDTAGEPDDADEYYSHDLEGFTCVDGHGHVLGTVAELLPGAAQDLLSVTPAHGDDVLVPFVSELVPQIDMEGRRIVLTPPEGLF